MALIMGYTEQSPNNAIVAASQKLSISTIWTVIPGIMIEKTLLDYVPIAIK